MTRPELLNRRTLLRGMGAGALAMTAAACLPGTSPGRQIPRGYSRQAWAAPRVSRDGVIRVVVGHRPFRPGGFVVRRDWLDGKAVVHNYGHGGGGIALAWGSSALALREVRADPPGEVAVLGCGVMGLTSARLLQDAGWNVTIYTRDTWRHTTSNIAAGEWSGFSAHDSGVASAEFKARLEWAARVSHHAYTNLTGPRYGVRWLETYQLRDTPISEFMVPEQYPDLFAYKQNLAPGEHPFGDRHAQRNVTMQISTGVLLRQLVRDFQDAGGDIVHRDFASLSQVLSLKQTVIFNCTGLGSRELFGDQELTAVKGQLVFLPPDPAVDYMTMGGGDGVLYMIPRSDVLVLGGTYRRGDFSRDIEAQETERIVEQHRQLFADFGRVV